MGSSSVIIRSEYEKKHLAADPLPGRCRAEDLLFSFYPLFFRRLIAAISERRLTIATIVSTTISEYRI